MGFHSCARVTTRRCDWDYGRC